MKLADYAHLLLILALCAPIFGFYNTVQSFEAYNEPNLTYTKMELNTYNSSAGLFIKIPHPEGCGFPATQKTTNSFA